MEVAWYLVVGTVALASSPVRAFEDGERASVIGGDVWQLDQMLN